MENRVLIGHFREPNPPYPPKGVDVVLCPCENNLWTREDVYDHWKRGCFDTPVYATKQEVIDRMIEKGVISS